MEAKTINRPLEFDTKAFGFKRNEENPLDCDLLVVDESSMVNVSLMQYLMKVVASAAALLIVGDIDQLPSVGPGQVPGRHHRLRRRARGSAHRSVPPGLRGVRGITTLLRLGAGA